jgi:hypothetical protein
MEGNRKKRSGVELCAMIKAKSKFPLFAAAKKQKKLHWPPIGSLAQIGSLALTMDGWTLEGDDLDLHWKEERTLDRGQTGAEPKWCEIVVAGG